MKLPLAIVPLTKLQSISSHFDPCPARPLFNGHAPP